MNLVFVLRSIVTQKNCTCSQSVQYMMTHGVAHDIKAGQADEDNNIEQSEVIVVVIQ